MKSASSTDTAKDLAAVLEHLAKKATPGPWKSGSPNFSCTMDHQHGRGECRYEFRGWNDGEYWAKYIHRDKPMAANTDAEQVAGTWDYEEGGIQRREDAELIVALINNLPAILEAMRQCGPNGGQEFVKIGHLMRPRSGDVHFVQEAFSIPLAVHGVMDIYMVKGSDATGERS